MGEMQEFGRWGQPVPVQEFGKGFPVPAQEFGRWGQPVPVQEFGKGWPVPVQEFGRGFPLVDQGWRSPQRETPSSSRLYLH